MSNVIGCNLPVKTVWLTCIVWAVKSDSLWHSLSLYSQDLIVDQTIEKVSFCAPDRNYDKAFSYICRDGTTRRWMCHCFMALKDSVRGRLKVCLVHHSRIWPIMHFSSNKNFCLFDWTHNYLSLLMGVFQVIFCKMLWFYGKVQQN